MPRNNSVKPLTCHTEGSVRELWSLAFPLILSVLSGNLMMFIDRFILARFSADAMNAAAATGAVAGVFHFGTMGIAAITGVFVGQYNGAKKHSKMGEPAWQMIWFSVFTTIIFLYFGIFGAHWFVPYNYFGLGLSYYQWLMFFGPFVPLSSALSAFFVGKGNSRLPFYATLIGNVFNLLLDIVLIFGVEGAIPPLGATGAAIATVTSFVIQVGILFVVFLNKENRQEYGTSKWHCKIDPLWKCIKIGTPNAVGHMLIIAAWAYMLHLMAETSKAHITVFTISQSILILICAINYGVFTKELLLWQLIISGQKNRLL